MLPAYAGMILGEGIVKYKASGAPRVCGDDPDELYGGHKYIECSPRIRG